MHGNLIQPPTAHFSLAASREFPITSASTERMTFFSAGATTSDNPSVICPIVSLASPTTLIAVLLCLFLLVHTLIFYRYWGLFDKHESV